MTIIRGQDRETKDRGPGLPSLQRLVDRAGGSEAMTVIVNTFAEGDAVPEHVHEVEEVLLVTAGECVVVVGDSEQTAGVGDAVIVKPGVPHAIRHPSAQECTVMGVLGSPDVTIWSEEQ